MAKAKDVLRALDELSGGRCITTLADRVSGQNPWVVTKSSGIPGKAITETPGLVWGDPEMEIKKIACMMTMTENAIELAASTGVDAIVSHHPISEAGNSGGVAIKYYLGGYNLACFELHEAFHGTHPGIPWLHGHKPFWTNTSYGGVVGNIVHVGNALPGVNTLGEMIDRLDVLMNAAVDVEMLEAERKIRRCEQIQEPSVNCRAKILVGTPESKFSRIIHIFPHCGFTPEHLERLVQEHPDVDTLLGTISRVYPGNPLIEKARELGLNFVLGNSHALECFENGVPMAYALKNHLPDCEIVMFRERMISTPLDSFGSAEIRDYARNIAAEYLPRK